MVPLRFRLETVALHPESFLLIFSRAKDTLYQKMGIGGLPGGPRGRGRTQGVGRAPLSPGPPGGPPVSIFCYMKSFTLEKIISKLSGRNTTATRRNLGGTNLGLRRSCLPGKYPSGRGKSSPSSSPTILSSGGGQSPSTSSSAPSPLKP